MKKLTIEKNYSHAEYTYTLTKETGIEQKPSESPSDETTKGGYVTARVYLPTENERNSIDTFTPLILTLSKSNTNSPSKTDFSISQTNQPFPIELKPESAGYLVTLDPKKRENWMVVDSDLVQELASIIGGDTAQDDAATYLQIVSQILKNHILRLGRSDLPPLKLSDVCDFVWGHVDNVTLEGLQGISKRSGSFLFNLNLKYK